MKRKAKRIRVQATTDQWDWNAEVGQHCLYLGWPCRLEASRGRHKRDAGELTPVKLKAPPGMTFELREGPDGYEWWWVPIEEGQTS